MVAGGGGARVAGGDGGRLRRLRRLQRLGWARAGWRGGWEVGRDGRGRGSQPGPRRCPRDRGRWGRGDKSHLSWRAATALLMFVLCAPSVELVVVSCIVF